MKLVKEHSIMRWTAFKLFLAGAMTLVLIGIFILVIAAAGQQSVYRNMNIDKNAFVETWEYVWNYGGVKQ